MAHAPAPLDHLQDLSGGLRSRLAELHPLPEYVKTAATRQPTGDVAYACPSQRAFPVATKADTWLSCAAFPYTRHKLAARTSEADVNETERRLQEAAAYWGIADAVRAVWQKAASDDVTTAMLPDRDFAFVWVDEAGRRQRHYPMRNTEEVFKAASWFHKYQPAIAFEDANRVALRILQQADRYQIEPPHAEQLQKVAGYAYGANVDAAAAWDARADMVSKSNPEAAVAARQVAATLRDSVSEKRGSDVSGILSEMDHGSRVKHATVMDRFDRQHGLVHHYGDLLERPEDVLFAVTEKSAAAYTATHVATAAGDVYSKAALSSLKAEDLTEQLGDATCRRLGLHDGFTADLEKIAAAVVDDADAATAVGRAASAVGVLPTLALGSGAAGPDTAELQRWATAYTATR